MTSPSSNPNICHSCSSDTYITLHYAKQPSSLKEIAHRVCISCIDQLSNNGQFSSIQCPCCLENVEVSYISPQVVSIDRLYQKLQSQDSESIDASEIERLRKFIKTSCSSLFLKEEHVAESLLFAVEKRDKDLISFFLNHRNIDLKTRLEGIQIAIEKGFPEIIKELIGSEESTEYWETLLKKTKLNLEDLNPANILNLEIRVLNPDPKYKMAMALLQLGHKENGDCLSFLGRCFQDGIGVSKDVIKASDLYIQGQNSNSMCAYLSAELRLTGQDGYLENLDEAIHLFKQGAEQFNNTNCMLRLGNYFRQRSGIAEDKIEAAKWYQKGAELGNAKCMFWLAECLRRGIGVDINLEEAARWYQEGANAGDGNCMFHLGDFYRDGTVFAKNIQQALALYRSGADLKNSDCMHRLGKCHLEGTGVQVNHQTASHWFEEGAKAGNGRCMVDLGISLYRGTGIQQNSRSAFHWFIQSLESLSSPEDNDTKGKAYLSLGNLCKSGLGCPKDPPLALYYYSEAAARGYPQAEGLYKILENQL